MRHTYGVLAFLGHAGVIDNPGADRHTLLDYRNDEIYNARQQTFIVPRRVCDKMVHRLMSLPKIRRHDPRRHWFNALALAGKQQSGAIRPKRLDSIKMP